MNLKDWASKKVQNFTGEAERRELVEQFKQVHNTYLDIIRDIVACINNTIQQYNLKIENINKFRINNVKSNINNLGNFLCKFGNISKNINFEQEQMRNSISIPDKQFELVENYIKDVDWSQEEIFMKSFSKGIFGTKSHTQNQNKEIIQKKNDYKVAMEQVKNRLNQLHKNTELDIEIANLYYENIKLIDTTIQDKIIPEIEFIESMLEAESIKNKFISDKNLDNILVNKDISLLNGTIYKKHFNFIKNSFMYYIISKKIYDTSVLTKLLDYKEDLSGSNELEDQKTLLLEQGKVLEESMI